MICFHFSALSLLEESSNFLFVCQLDWPSLSHRGSMTRVMSSGSNDRTSAAADMWPGAPRRRADLEATSFSTASIFRGEIIRNCWVRVLWTMPAAHFPALPRWAAQVTLQTMTEGGMISLCSLQSLPTLLKSHVRLSLRSPPFDTLMMATAAVRPCPSSFFFFNATDCS